MSAVRTFLKAACASVVASMLASAPAGAAVNAPGDASAGAAPAPPGPPAAGARAPAAPSPKRTVPDYDGRGVRPSASAGKPALWIPRVLLSPLYLTHEYLVRRPLAAIVPAMEKADLPRKLHDFFLFAPDHKGGIVPVGFVEFNFQPSVGVYGFWNDGPWPNNDVSLHLEGWSSEWLAASLSERVRFSKGYSMLVKLRGVRRPDNMFFGLGPSAREEDQSRYGTDRLDGSVAFGAALWRQSRVDTTVGVRRVRLYDGHFGGDPSVDAEAARGAFRLPPGFPGAYSAQYSRIAAVYDDRRPWPAPGSGVRLEAHVEQGSAFEPSPGSGWIRYGATLGGFLDLNRYRRVLSLSAAVRLVDPIRGGTIPFTELESLGGEGPMPGFTPGRLVDRSTAAAVLRYVWPVAPWINASLQIATGNVFGSRLEGFRPGLLRLSGALGLVFDALPDAPFELLVGAGTETFDDRLRLNTARVAFGVNRF